MHEKLTREYNENKELQEVISKSGEFFAVDLPEISQPAKSSVRGDKGTGWSPLLKEPAGDEMALRFRNITGVVPSDDRLKFERMIFRTTRGNCYTRFSPIAELLTDPTVRQYYQKSIVSDPL